MDLIPTDVWLVVLWECEASSIGRFRIASKIINELLFPKDSQEHPFWRRYFEIWFGNLLFVCEKEQKKETRKKSCLKNK